MIKPWSSRPAVIDVVLEFFDATTKCIDMLGPGLENAGEVAEPKSQLPDLAAVLLACFQERLDWLRRYVTLHHARRGKLICLAYIVLLLQMKRA
jgi:nuclear pore complex protein Nup133